ncbi:MAG: SCO family protein [Gammaproteobacteria bacterium]|nr:SCO family protein [Gammaproteobacteria bacterium]MYD80731.1 SCO family protein [Gammaproteobacteria bacterium]
MKIRIAIFAVIILVLGGAYWYAVQTGDDRLSAQELKALGLVELTVPTEVGELVLLDHQAADFGAEDLKGKWTYAFFGYTHCPDICPITLSLLRETEEQLSENASSEVFSQFRGMFVSVDPTRDDVETVKRFVSHFSPNFVGLTGTEANIKQFADTVGVGFMRMGSNTSALEYLVEHQGHIVIFSPDGSCYGYIKPPHDPTQLARIFRYLVSSSQEAQTSS